MGSAHPRTRREQDPLLATYITSYFLQQNLYTDPFNMIMKADREYTSRA